jgi:hypothetical protein
MDLSDLLEWLVLAVFLLVLVGIIVLRIRITSRRLTPPQDDAESVAAHQENMAAVAMLGQDLE